MPSAGRAAMRFQEEEGRYCLSMLYASPIKRGAVEVIEDMPPLYNIPVKVQVPEKIERIYLAVSGEEIPFTRENGTVEFCVPYLQCHQLVVLKTQ